MYGGGNIFEPTKLEEIQQEDQEKLGQFEARIGRGEKIEPADWMPSLYRRQLILRGVRYEGAQRRLQREPCQARWSQVDGIDRTTKRCR